MEQLINQNQNSWKIAIELLYKINRKIQGYKENEEECLAHGPLLNGSIESIKTES